MKTFSGVCPRRASVLCLIFFVGSCLTLAESTIAGAPAQEPLEIFDASVVAEGREVYSLACVQCHGPNQARIQRKAADGWRRTIYSMIGRGAPVLPDEIEPLTAYLTSTYGPAAPPPVFGDASGDVAVALPEGGERVMAACGACHAVNLVFESRKTESEWIRTIEAMRSFGASVTDSEQRLIVEYLTEHFGRD